MVTKYTHLGTVDAENGSMTPEIIARAGMMRTAAKPLRRKVLANKFLDQADRVGPKEHTMAAHGLT